MGGYEEGEWVGLVRADGWVIGGRSAAGVEVGELEGANAGLRG